MTDERGRDPAERGILRLFYRDWRPTRLGRIANRLTEWWASKGLPPRFQQTLEVRGRKSGQIRSTPVVVTTVEGERYLVAMLGPDSEWVKNVRAAGGEAALRHGGRQPVRLEEVPPEQRAPVLAEYVRIATSGRRHIPVAPGASLAEFDAVAHLYPVFRIASR